MNTVLVDKLFEKHECGYQRRFEIAIEKYNKSKHDSFTYPIILTPQQVDTSIVTNESPNNIINKEILTEVQCNIPIASNTSVVIDGSVNSLEIGDADNRVQEVTVLDIRMKT